MTPKAMAEGNVSSPDNAVIQPYMYEPDASDSSDGEASEAEERRDNTDWCQCGNCEPMPTNTERVCCREVDAIESKMQESQNDIECITDHEGFQSVYLDVWVLQTAYHNYRQKYGDAEEKSLHEYISMAVATYV